MQLLKKIEVMDKCILNVSLFFHSKFHSKTLFSKGKINQVHKILHQILSSKIKGKRVRNQNQVKQINSSAQSLVLFLQLAFH